MEMNALFVSHFSIHTFDELALMEHIDNFRKADVEVFEALQFHVIMWNMEDCLDNLNEIK